MTNNELRSNNVVAKCNKNIFVATHAYRTAASSSELSSLSDDSFLLRRTTFLFLKSAIFSGKVYSCLYLKEELIKKDNSLSSEVTKLQTWKQGYRNILMVGIVWYKSEVDWNVSMRRISIFSVYYIETEALLFPPPCIPSSY